MRFSSAPWSFALCVAIAAACTQLEPGRDTFDRENVAGAGGARSGSSNLGGEPDAGGFAGIGNGGADSAGSPGQEGGSGPEGGCPEVGQRPLKVLGESGEVTLNADARWTCQFDYQLSSNVFVASGATLTVDPSVTVKMSTKVMLLVQRGGLIEAVGEVAKPITFTSAKAPGQREAGDHRGLIIIGDGPSQTTTQPVYDSVSGTRAHYGGGQAGNPKGSCGRLKYVRVEFGGGSIDDSSLPAGALTLAGCGAGTLLDYVQIHRATDGLGFLGGNVGARHVVVSNTVLGEGIEWSAGYTGTLQFVVAQTLGASAAMQGSNSADNREASPVSRPVIHNATLVGIYDEVTKRAPAITGQHFGFNLQLGSGAVLKNAIVLGFADAAFDWDLEPAAVAAEVGPGKSVDISHVLLFDNKAPYSSRAQALSTMQSMRAQDPGLPAAANPTENEATAVPLFAPVDPTVNTDPTGAPPGFDVTAGFRGAVPQDGEDWTRGWTSYPVD